MPLLLGSIADDFTGATDLCNMLVRHGMRVVQLLELPETPEAPADVDAVTVALKIRTCPVEEARERALAALAWLRGAGARQFFFKYCSTFDSTERGNIGPVADALLDALGADFTIACPAFPETGRTVYKGHLFVGDRLLSDTHMRHHPLTPMTDSNLLRVLGRQTPHRVGLVDYAVVRRGEDAIRSRFAALRAEGVRYAVTDVLHDGHLLALGHACADLPLVTGGSGIAMGLPDNFRAAGMLAADRRADALPAVRGHEAVLAGSCSAATLEQIRRFAEHRPAFYLDPLALAEGFDSAEAVAWAKPRLAAGPVLIHASAPPEAVRAAQEALGRERAIAAIARSTRSPARSRSRAAISAAPTSSSRPSG